MTEIEKKLLRYDTERWEEIPMKAVNTLQLFITNKCNLRCHGCFYEHKLGKGEMSLEQYDSYVKQYQGAVEKVILLGGEPTVHPQLGEMLAINQAAGLKTTIYTNGFKLGKLEEIYFDRNGGKNGDKNRNNNLEGVKIRLGVYGVERSEKPLVKVPRTKLPVTIVYMLRRDNVDELMSAAKMAEEEFSCGNFFISSIRDIAASGDYWKDTADTLSLPEYFQVVQDFVNDYHGLLNLHISKRGIIKSAFETDVDHCRFGNIFPDGKKIGCSLDISLEKYCRELEFGEKKRKCDKDKLCLLRKVVLRRKGKFEKDG